MEQFQHADPGHDSAQTDVPVAGLHILRMDPRGHDLSSALLLVDIACRGHEKSCKSATSSDIPSHWAVLQVWKAFCFAPLVRERSQIHCTAHTGQQVDPEEKTTPIWLGGLAGPPGEQLSRPSLARTIWPSSDRMQDPQTCVWPGRLDSWPANTNQPEAEVSC